MWQASKEQHNQHLILLLDLFKEVQKTPANTTELIEATKIAINQTPANPKPTTQTTETTQTTQTENANVPGGKIRPGTLGKGSPN
jgi:hypothetical protein